MYNIKMRYQNQEHVEELPSDSQPVNIEVKLPYVQHKDALPEPRTCGRVTK